MPQLGKMLIIVGALAVVIGVILLFTDKIPFLGKLPGDLTFSKGNVKVYIPLATMLLISLLLTLILNFLGRWR